LHENTFKFSIGKESIEKHEKEDVKHIGKAKLTFNQEAGELIGV
jgi:hypothetical protein